MTDPKPLGLFHLDGVKLDYFGGNCPVQAEGMVDGKHFYFRARHSNWQFYVADTDEQIFKNPIFHREGIYGSEHEAGWMEIGEARGLFVGLIHAFRVQSGAVPS